MVVPANRLQRLRCRFTKIRETKRGIVWKPIYTIIKQRREQLPNLFSQKAQIGGDQESLGAAALSSRGNKREHFSQANGPTCDHGQGGRTL